MESPHTSRQGHGLINALQSRMAPVYTLGDSDAHESLSALSGLAVMRPDPAVAFARGFVAPFLGINRWLGDSVARA